jgi:hypothetical protein
MKYVIFRYFSIGIFIFTSIFSFGQSNNDKIRYKGVGFYMHFIAESGEKTTHPYGKEYILTYDKFFKSYTIHYKDENDQMKSLSFKYHSGEGDLTKVEDSYGSFYYVTDFLSTHGKLILIFDRKVEGITTALTFENAVPY